MMLNRKKAKKGYTLIELSVVIVLVVMIAATLVAMLTQQVNFMTWWRSQKFIAEDAPLVNNMVVRVFSKADAFRIHGTEAGALANTGGISATTGGMAMKLGFTRGDGSKVFGMIEFTAPIAPATTGTLSYHVLNATGSASVSEWAMASDISDADFGIAAGGTMQLTLTGPYGGQITYGVTPTL